MIHPAVTYFPADTMSSDIRLLSLWKRHKHCNALHTRFRIDRFISGCNASILIHSYAALFQLGSIYNWKFAAAKCSGVFRVCVVVIIKVHVNYKQR